VGSNNIEVNSVITILEQDRLDLTREKSLAYYLGAQVDHTGFGDLFLSQPGLT
jgi:hypothetical protein